MIDKNLTKTEAACLAFIKNYTPQTAIYNYTSSLCLEAVLKAAQILNKPEWIVWVRERACQFLKEDGSVTGFEKEEYSMDKIRTGNLYFSLYNLSGEEKYKKAMDSFIDMMKSQPRTASGGYWHKKRYPDQMWLDGFYMSEPLCVKYAGKWGDLKVALDEAKNQLSLMYSHTVKPNGLLLHAWDESGKMYWADKKTGCSGYVWSRAVGWVIMAIADILELLPATDEFEGYRAFFADYALKLASALVKVQDVSTGMWYQVTDMGGYENNFLETSGTLMFAYGFAKMNRMGILDNSFRDAAVRAFDGVVKFKTYYDKDENFHIKDICKSAGLGKAEDTSPFRDGSYNYYTLGEERAVDNMHGVGSFILAGLEIEYGGKKA